ncbi:MAG: ATP-dependent DNA helicase [Oscillospiraceae bacterium]|nr:ATP-dependent DNA helicase [Oscillospiraceae bacterium]
MDNQDKQTIRCSVRNLVEFVLACGDIDYRFKDMGALYEGSRAHRRIQRSMGSGYAAEVPLSWSVDREGYRLEIEGRADGIYEDDGLLVIDEIKSTTLTFDRLQRQALVHYGQAMCYAYIYCASLAIPPESLSVQLTYFQLETEEIKRQRKEITFTELEDFFDDIIDRYCRWLDWADQHRRQRNAAAQSMAFPYPAYRGGQREMAAAVFRTVRDAGKLFVQAPTGIGKTVSALFPAVKAMGCGHGEKLFYFTAKTITRQVAEEGLAAMRKAGAEFLAVTLTAKDKICPNRRRICDPDHCERARGHYDRVQDAVWELLAEHQAVTREAAERVAETHRVCPYEMALDAALWADGVIGDYNYLFDPRVYLRRFFDNGGDYLFLIDEAHNLPDRLREMHSASVGKQAFSQIKRGLKGREPVVQLLKKSAAAVNQWFLDTCREYQNRDMPLGSVPEELEILLTLFRDSASAWLSEKPGLPADNAAGQPLEEIILDAFFETLYFLQVRESYAEREGEYAVLLENEGGPRLTLFCIDPREKAAASLAKGRAAVMFSATLNPPEYYRQILGGDRDDPVLALPSPFARENLTRITHYGISTKYTDREASYGAVAEAIAVTAGARRGNYMVFFPSFDYLRRVGELFALRYPEITVITQRGGMEESAREQFLAAFDPANTETLVGFCVMGGIFSEGIDLRGDRLTGSIIVGVGLPKLSMRGDSIRNYYNELNNCGYEYAYIYPGYNKVMQAVGRVIRGEQDTGTAVLIDSRFANEPYLSLTPEHWQPMGFVGSNEELFGACAAAAATAPVR